MSPITIRAAKCTDLDKLNRMMYQLHHEHHLQSPELFKPANEIDKTIAHYLDHPECLVFVAVDNGDVVGFISGHFGQYQSPVSKPVMMGSVDELYVESDYRKSGIASKLMDKIEQTLDDYGARYLFVEVWESNPTAVQFYLTQGYQSHIHCLMKVVRE
ncbi:GNAT family N-acetyltransferase [Vibrio sp. WXL210]|uniref:GNAT family N-acetyltransferase n=1 Tax=Vibrio sp. WXL210 TaxID=3450709 RepID=UPI003EC7AD1E